MSEHPRADRLELIGIPFGAGQSRDGVELAPDALRLAGLNRALFEAGWLVEDRGNIQWGQGARLEVELPGLRTSLKQPKFKQEECIARSGREIADAVARSLSAGSISLQIGGDHGIALGSIAGALRIHPDLRVIWVDAHGDSNTPETSPTGNFHGMPVAALLGLFSLREHPGFEWLGPALRPDRIALVGVRDLDAGERALIDSMGITHYSAQEVKSRGASALMDECLRRLDPGARAPIHYSLDIDALDPTVAPSTGVPVTDGLTVEEVEAIGRKIASSGRLVSMDLVEINPLCGDALSRELTLQAGLRAILSGLGRSSRFVNEAS